MQMRSQMSSMSGEDASSLLSAKLSSKYFRPGDPVRGVLQFQGITAENLELQYIVAKLHGHVTVDSNVLSVPVIADADTTTSSTDSSITKAMPSMNDFSGETGACIYESSPVILFNRDESDSSGPLDFSMTLPNDLCPTFKGTSARVFYILSITAITETPQSIHLPLDIYGSEYSFDQAASNSHATSTDSSVTSENSSGSVPFDLRLSLLHGRVETETMERAQTSLFTIGKENSHLVKFILTKQSYGPGEEILGVFDFANASIPCSEVKAALHLEETLGSMSLDPSRVVQTKEVGTFHERTKGVKQTHLRFTLPPDALPTIRTDLVSFLWTIKFEFTTAGQEESAQTFRWQVPVVIKPPVNAKTEKSVRVPHRMYMGSAKVLSLA